MSNYVTTDTEITSIANAIRTKGKTSAQLTYPAGFVSAIGAIDTRVAENDVIYYDYDGTIVDSYSAADFLQLTAHPDNPTHTGLTAQGWNWTLSDAQDFVEDYGKLSIGQMYLTTNKKTKLYISLKSADRLTVPLNWYQSDDSGVHVDWGDGFEVRYGETGYLNKTHTYDQKGDYVIQMIVITGTMQLGGKNTSNAYIGCLYDTSDNKNIYQNSLTKIEIGKDTTLMDSALMYSKMLKSVTIPTGATTISNSVFIGCYNLKHVTLPDSITTIGSGLFYGCTGLESVSMPNVTLTESLFFQCEKLKRVDLLPLNVPTAGLYYYCRILEDIEIPDNTVTIPDNAYKGCRNIYELELPNTVTSIGNNSFTECENLTNITIPSGVTSMGYNVFSTCKSLKEVHMLPTTPPTLSDNNAFGYCSNDFVIYVPSGYLSTYQSAQYWSTWSSRMVEE